MPKDFDQDSNTGMRPAAIVGGSIVLALGILMLLDRTGAIDVHAGRLIAPAVLIILGATMVFDKGGIVYSQPFRDERGDMRMRVRKRGGSTGGLWLIGVGSWMMISQSHLWGLGYHNSWPLLIILMGILMVFRGWR